MMTAISVKSLYEYLGGRMTTYGLRFRFTKDEITGAEYYDLIERDGCSVCMDGEECDVRFDKEKDMYWCKNNEGEHSIEFALSPEEFGVCTFC